ncbi:type IX secretion system protein PorQ [bacterium SCSIO 12643]|nr:type IX secretion system protein PorQ [bacterium SCSIO 12643]
MKKNILLLLFGFQFFTLVGQVNSTQTYKFLNLPTSARSAAMGGSFISSGTHDLNLVADNPSVLDSTMDKLATITYINYISDINMGYVAYSKHYDGIGTFSGGLQFMGYGDFIRADETGTQNGTFKAGDYAFDVSYGRHLDSLFSVGASMKLIYSNYDYLNSFGVAFDLGATYVSKNKLFTAGAVMNNMGFEIVPYFKGQRQKLPFNMQLAGSIKLAKAPLRFTLLVNNLQKWNLVGNQAVEGLPTIGPSGGSIATDGGSSFTVDNLFRHFIFGAEIVPSENFFIQIAYNHLRKSELSVPLKTTLNAFSFGLGMRIKRLKFSYAVASYTSAGTSHHLTLSTDLKTFRRKSSSN